MSNKRKILIEFSTRIDVDTICVKSPTKTIKVGWSLEMVRDLVFYGIDVEKESIKFFNQKLENE